MSGADGRCPQTVFIDAVYRRIEVWIEGDYLARRKLRSSDLTLNKFTKVTLKWIAFFLVSSIIAHSLIAYFTGADHLIQMLGGAPSENWSYFLIVSAVTAALMFNFGWFREQFCIIMCPYGRFQSVLMDVDSVSVAYDEKRGEPRKGSFSPPTKGGDCVGCNRCVQVCPTDIDIRKGAQMECIGCTACIDACNEIMKRVNKAPDLIAYRSLSGSKYRIVRTRPLVLLGLAFVCLVALVTVMSQRSAYAINILRATDSPYQILADGVILNHFKIHVMNQSQGQEEFEITIPKEIADRGVKLTQNLTSTVVDAGSSAEVQFFLLFPRNILNRNGDLTFELILKETRTQITTPKTITILGPQ